MNSIISYIKGKIEYASDSHVIIENNGIGYKVYVSSNTLGKLYQSAEVKIHTYMNVKEDSLELYGFLNADELTMFNRLITVSGVGPKGAQAMLNLLTPAEFALAVVAEDVITLSKAPGVGKKTAQRIILELKDRVKTQEALIEQGSVSTIPVGNERQDAIEALATLGYSRSEAVRVVMQITEGVDLNLEDIIKLSLKKLSK